MKSKPCSWTLLALAVLLLVAPAAWSQQAGMHIGYVYPAGGKQGSTFEAIIAGQFLYGAGDVCVSGSGVEAKITDMIKPIAGGELNKLRIEMDDLMARKAVVHNDFRALEYFRNFKNAKSVKKDPAEEDKEIAELKKKYAHATWTSADEQRVAEIRHKVAMSVRKPANPAISELAVVQFTVAADAQPGPREVRVASRSGLSNPLAFYVGTLPEFSKPLKKEITQQKSAIQKTAILKTKAKSSADPEVTLPVVINGQILPGAVDRFRFQARKGQGLVAVVSARQLIPYIADAVPGWFQATVAIYDGQGKELAYDDDFRFNPDPVLHYVIPADGEYVVEIKDAIYRGREDFVYRITLGELPFVTGVFPLGGPAGTEAKVKLAGWNLPAASLTMDTRGKAPGIYPLALGSKDQLLYNPMSFAVDALPECWEKEPNDKVENVQHVTLPIIINGRIKHADDSDVFCFEGKAGEEVVAEVMARRLGSPLDSAIRLTDASGRQVAFNDDWDDKGAGLLTHQADSYFRVALPADGKYYLRLVDAQHKGGPEYAYRLRISAPQPDFALRIVPSSIIARTTPTVPITVYALRKDGFAGEIALTLKNAPPGYVLNGGAVPAGQDLVRLTLSVPLRPQSEPVQLNLEGRQTIEGRVVCRPAVPAEDMIQAFEYRHLVTMQELMVHVTSRLSSKGGVRILSELPVRIPAGGTARVQVGTPSSRSYGSLHLELSDPPEGIAIKTVSMSRAGIDIVLQSDAAKVKPGLKGNLIVTLGLKSSSGSKSKSKSTGRSGQSLGVLPAIPFEITGS